jgi:serine/threonine protein kinase
MSAVIEHNDAIGALERLLRDDWELLCAKHLPFFRENSVWRYSRPAAPGDLDQGWKLHISATVLTANDVFRKVTPVLQARNARFKAPSSLAELQKLNCGLFYGYSQVGKFITVYPHSAEEAVSLASRLAEVTQGFKAPPVPFDLRYRPPSCIYYRYGSFKHLEIQNADGSATPALRAPNGSLVSDERESETARPDWVSDPFVESCKEEDHVAQIESALGTVRAFQALAQRGKGGVYKALDLSASPPRICLLKEGRANGELGWDGNDGRSRVHHEETVLTCLRTAGIAVPKVYSSFEVEDNYYLVSEFMEGETLQSLMYKRRRRFSLERSLLYGSLLSTLIASIHSAGWAWRDCKPSNIIVTENNVLRPLDFEGACPADSRLMSQWSTRGFTPPLLRNSGDPHAARYYDLYALGAVIYLLLTGKIPELPVRDPIEKLRRCVPIAIRELVDSLLSDDPMQRPEASDVAAALMRVAGPEKNGGQRFSESSKNYPYAGGLPGSRLSRRARSTNRGSERSES